MTRHHHDVAVDAAVRERLIAHLRDGSTDLADTDLLVPAQHFVGRERMAAEVALMKRLPLLAAHCSQLARPGDFLTLEMLGTPLLLVRRTDGSAQAYLNMCRHRGGRVEPAASGSKRVFMCRYHGWSYDRDSGGLRHVPYESSFDMVEPDAHALIALHTQERHGLIFVDLSTGAGSNLADWLGAEVDAQIEPWQLRESTQLFDRTYALQINWKLVMDGAIDVIHPRFLHADGVGKLIESNVGVFRSYGRHGQHFGARTKLRTLVDENAAYGSGSRYIASNLVLYPNTMMIGAPEHVELWTVWPDIDDPARCTVHIRFLVRTAILDPQIEQRVHKSWEILERAATQEDWPMERWIQQNAQARPQALFRYGRSELACQHLHRQLAHDLDP